MEGFFFPLPSPQTIGLSFCISPRARGDAVVHIQHTQPRAGEELCHGHGLSPPQRCVLGTSGGSQQPVLNHV